MRGELDQQLEYRCRWAGKHLVRADRSYPSSKTCSEFSTKTEDIALKERIWMCALCGVAMNRDSYTVQPKRAVGMHKLTEAEYVFRNRAGDADRLGAWSVLA